MAARKELCLGLWAVCLLCGCGSDGGDDSGPKFTIASTTLAGVVGGQPWSLISAETDAFLSEGETSFFTSAYASAGTLCELGATHTGNEIILLVPKSPGDYSIGFALSATFVVDPGGANQNLVATRGRIVVDEVSATSVRGGAAIEYNDQNQVNGRFEASVCPPR